MLGYRPGTGGSRAVGEAEERITESCRSMTTIGDFRRAGGLGVFDFGRARIPAARRRRMSGVVSLQDAAARIRRGSPRFPSSWPFSAEVKVSLDTSSFEEILLKVVVWPSR